MSPRNAASTNVENNLASLANPADGLSSPPAFHLTSSDPGTRSDNRGISRPLLAKCEPNFHTGRLHYHKPCASSIAGGRGIALFFSHTKARRSQRIAKR